MTPSVLCRGLRPQPLASYLGALGLFRIASMQLDRSIRGAFTPRGFELTGIDEGRLLQFLLDAYAPSPALSPWNAASGFYKGGKAGPAIEAIAQLREKNSPRLGLLLRTFDEIARILAQEGLEAAPKDEEKARLFMSLRGRVADEALPWVDAVAASQPDRLVMMPLLGSGGNEGVLEYSGVFFRSLVDVLDDDRAKVLRLARALLFGEVSADLIERSGGQFDPGNAGGFNTGPGFEHKDLPKNPWAHVLLIEGAMAWTSSVGSRGQDVDYPYAVSPFTVRLRAAGYGSAAQKDEEQVRAEIWTPIFDRPTTFAELSAFLREGRVDVRTSGAGARRAEDSLDFARAVSSLGVDRGVAAFTRYALIKRRGDSYLALPTGRFEVAEGTSDDLAGELHGPMERIGRFLRGFAGDGPPGRLLAASRRLDAAHFDLAANRPGSALRTMVALGAWERETARRDPSRDPQMLPLTGLSERWFHACLEESDHSPEVRLAMALRSLEPVGGRSLRSLIAPVDPARDHQLVTGSPALAWHGGTLAARIASLLTTRLRHAQASGTKHVTRGAFTAHLEDVTRFIDEFVDEVLLEDLLFAFQLVRVPPSDEASPRRGQGVRRPRLYDLCKLVLPTAPWRGPDADFADEAAVVPLLIAGRVMDAQAVAQRRVRALGLEPRTVLDSHDPRSPLGLRVAAALLIPISYADQKSLIRRVVIEGPRQELAQGASNEVE